MPRAIIPVLLGLTVVGCSGDNSNNMAPSSTSTASTSTSTTSTTSTTSGSTVSGTTGSSSPQTSNTAANNAAPNGYGVKDPDRLYQLDDLAKTTVKTAKGDLHLWIMDTESKRQEGMMFLRDKEVKDDEGMIFLFPEVQKGDGNYAFWMHNTLIPLDIDYISKDKKILNVGIGRPQNDDKVYPKGDYFYVIELKQGISQKYGLTAGTKVNISADLKGLP